MEKQKCKECAFFLQHYILAERRFIRIHCGHCTAGPVKTKKPEAVACQRFVSAPPDTAAFVSKEYLNKELLQYFLKLELLPHIPDADPDPMDAIQKSKKKQRAKPSP